MDWGGVGAGGATRWLRVGLLYLAASFLGVGLWATVAPRAFFERFPGGGHQWVSGGPYNAHFVSDTGVGFLAVGVVLVLAATWRERRLVQAALVATVVHGLPHAVFHLRHADESLGSADRWASTGALAFATLLAVVLLVIVTRATPAPRTPDLTSTNPTEQEMHAR